MKPSVPQAFFGARSGHVRQHVAKALLLLSLGLAFQSCKKEDVLGERFPEKDFTALSSEAIQVNTLQTAFAKTLASALQAEPALRTFLKQEANKKFNGDADVLYLFVKDKLLADGLSFHQHLAKYGAAQLEEIEAKSPLLTIFVPTLPSGFSPDTWNATTEVPVVAVSLRGSNTVPYYDATGKEQLVPEGAIPGFPTLVIKQNERVTTARPSAKAEDTALEFYRSSQATFRFIDKNFDNIHAQATLPQKAREQSYSANRIAPVYGSFDQKVINAYNTNGPDPNVQWQRDFVYYGISPTSARGPLDRNYREVIRTIKFSRAALDKMSDQSEIGNLKDPFLLSSAPTGSNPNWWTDGNFELQISVLINATNGIGPRFEPINSINPRDIFLVNYRQSGNYYYVSSVSPKEYNINIPLVPWDLQSYGSGWKFVFVERDNGGSEQRTIQNSSTFGTNFEVDASGTLFGLVKVGGKFGTTSSSSKTETHVVTINTGDDALGEMVLTFDRPVITWWDVSPMGEEYYVTEEINNGPNGYLTASVEPARF